MCGEKLDPKGNVRLTLDKQTVLRYLKSTSLVDQNEDDLCHRIARIFHKDIVYSRQIWTAVKREHPILIEQLRNRVVLLQIAQQQKPHEKSSAAFRPNSIYNLQNIKKLNQNLEKKDLEIKNLKPLDGFESEWKEGKMKPAEQKKYRSTFQDNE